MVVGDSQSKSGTHQLKETSGSICSCKALFCLGGQAPPTLCTRVWCGGFLCAMQDKPRAVLSWAVREILRAPLWGAPGINSRCLDICKCRLAPSMGHHLCQGHKSLSGKNKSQCLHVQEVMGKQWSCLKCQSQQCPRAHLTAVVDAWRRWGEGSAPCWGFSWVLGEPRGGWPVATC